MQGSAKPRILPDVVISALASDARISEVELTGSRAMDQATPLSDWDFMVTAPRFAEVRDALPQMVRPLHPVAELTGSWYQE
jgi:predicted nucleotidyltransferase